MSTPRIFLSYRRADASGHAGRLYDGLVDVFGEKHVFRDVASIEFGKSFVQAIHDHLAQADVVVVVIGPDWAGDSGAGGATRIFDERDVVRHEVSEALRSSARVIPVLVGGAVMPTREELPKVLHSLVEMNAFSLREDRDLYFLEEELRNPGGAQSATHTLDERAKVDPKPLVALVALGLLALLLWGARVDKEWLLAFLAVPAVLCLSGLWSIRRSGRRGTALALVGLLVTAFFLAAVLAT